MCVCGGCAHVHVKPEVDTGNLPQVLVTFSTEAGSSVEPRFTDTARLASHFARGDYG